MRIKNNSTVEFDKVNLAQVFEYEGALYMKIPCVDCREDDCLDGECDDCNAVSLSVGMLTRFSDWDMVRIVDAVLTVCS